MKLTPALSAILAAVLTLVATSLASYFAGAHLYVANGTIDYAGLGAYSLNTLLTIGAGIWTYLKSHPQQAEQAGVDLLTQLHAPVANIQATVSRIESAVAQINTQPVTVNVHPAPEVSSGSQATNTGPSLVNPLPVLSQAQNAATPVSVTLQGTVPNTVPPTIGFINPVPSTTTSYVPSNNVTQLFSGDMSGANTMPRLQVVK